MRMRDAGDQSIIGNWGEPFDRLLTKQSAEVHGGSAGIRFGADRVLPPGAGHPYYDHSCRSVMSRCFCTVQQ